ncbi:Holliday junction branch migration protein RuvA [Candidatus Uhrbacteria bacterium]|nr:Holliday junction branch migration protein RuvA [Candidatus Uhrbacteria bacterium]
MISFLTGNILHRGKDHVVVNISGVGYSAFVPAKNLDKFRVGQAVELHTHHQVREDAHDLFGFVTREELELFKQLLTVKGVGPKTALSVLNEAEAGAVSQAIASGDPARLAQTASIGLKNAERIVVDLKTKVIPFEGNQPGAEWQSQQDVIEALVSLGYSSNQAQTAVKVLPVELKDSAARVKAALKVLNS